MHDSMITEGANSGALVRPFLLVLPVGSNLEGQGGLGHVPRPRNFTIDKPVTIGRLPSNSHWLFSPSTPGVSSVEVLAGYAKIKTAHKVRCLFWRASGDLNPGHPA